MADGTPNKQTNHTFLRSDENKEASEKKVADQNQYI